MTKKNSTVKVLLVDDNKTLVDMYSLKFKEAKFDLAVAYNGGEGLDHAKKMIPDIILLDIMMPEMDGFAVLQELKIDPKTKGIPVILLSNLGQESDVIRGKELGATDYVVKSNFTPAQVLDKVKQYI